MLEQLSRTLSFKIVFCVVGVYLGFDFIDLLGERHALVFDSCCGIIARQSAGGTVGSSYALLDELIEIAPYLGIHLSADGSLPATEAARLFDISETPMGDFGQEITAWLSLHEAAELSINYGTSIVFTPSSS